MDDGQPYTTTIDNCYSITANNPTMYNPAPNGITINLCSGATGVINFIEFPYYLINI
jgi:hypothetical protein